MLDILDLGLTLAINILSLLIGAAVALIYVRKLMENTKKSIKPALEEWLNSDKGRQALYGIGVLIGNGARSGIGIGSKGGKLKFEDLLMQGLGSFFSKRPEHGETPNPQNLNPVSEHTGY